MTVATRLVFWKSLLSYFPDLAGLFITVLFSRDLCSEPRGDDNDVSFVLLLLEKDCASACDFGVVFFVRASG